MHNRNTRLIILVIVGLLLFTVMGFMVVKFVVNEEVREEGEELIVQLSDQLEEMEADIIELSVLYDDKDIEIGEAEKIIKLKSEQLGLMEKEIERLRKEGKVSKSRIRQLRLELENARNKLEIQRQSLLYQRANQKNEVLQATLDSLTAGTIDFDRYEKMKVQNVALTKEIEVLRGEVKELRPYKDVVAELRAENFSFINIKGGKKMRGLEFKANEINEIEICFTLLKNAMIDPGVKEVFIMLQRPDGVVMTNWSGYSARAKIDRFYREFSASTTVQYDKKDKLVCIPFKQSAAQSFMPGRNVIRVFSEGKFIGDAILNLN